MTTKSGPTRNNIPVGRAWTCNRVKSAGYHIALRRPEESRWLVRAAWAVPDSATDDSGDRATGDFASISHRIGERDFGGDFEAALAAYEAAKAALAVGSVPKLPLI